MSFAVCGSVCSHKLDEVDETQCARRVPLWSRCDDLILSRYQLYLDNLLQNIQAPDASSLSGASNLDYSSPVLISFTAILHRVCSWPLMPVYLLICVRLQNNTLNEYVEEKT